LGDAGAALDYLHLESDTDLSNVNISYFLERYFRPQPKIALGCFLRNYATAAIDISDGLLADFGHIAKLSGVGGILYENNIPCSDALKLEMGSKSLSMALTAGDDYELCFCLPGPQLEKLKNEPLFETVSVVGVVSSESGLKMKCDDGSEQVLSAKGYAHF
jgi:thiamine-monophosphate kinase